MKNYCGVKFEYSDKTLPPTLKKIVEGKFMESRNEVVDLLNPNYEKWNLEFEKTHGKLDYFDIAEYNNFIRDKMDIICKDFNESKRRYLQFYADEECNIAAWFEYRGKKIFMNMYIEINIAEDLKKLKELFEES